MTIKNTITRIIAIAMTLGTFSSITINASAATTDYIVAGVGIAGIAYEQRGAVEGTVHDAGKEETQILRTIPEGKAMVYGNRSERVGILQEFLKFEGYYEGEIDNSYGPATRKAVKKYQSENSLEVDGKCGPATTRSINQRIDTINSNSEQVSPSDSDEVPTNEVTTITTEDIYEVLDKYGYKTGAYWTRYEPSAKNSDCSQVRFTKDDDLYASGTKATKKGDFKSFNYESSWECAGFSRYVMSKVTNTDCIPRNGSTEDWEKVTNVTELKVGDIVVTSGHSAIVLYVDGTNCQFAEAWGSYGSKIAIGGKFNGSCATLEEIKNTYNLKYVYRFKR